MRALTTIATLAASLALLAGCGGDDETTSSTTPATTAATGATGPTGDEGAGPPDADDQPDAGGGGGGGAPSAGADPEAALEEFFTSGDPDLVCGELATDELLASAYGDEQGCRQAQVPAAVPKSIEIVELDEDGDTATAVVVPRGGPNDGFDHDVTLVREGDTWVVDTLEADIPAGP